MVEKPIVVTNDKVVEENFTDEVVTEEIKIENEVITEEEKKDIREEIENKLPDNIIQTKRGRPGFHNVVYTR